MIQELLNESFTCNDSTVSSHLYQVKTRSHFADSVDLMAQLVKTVLSSYKRTCNVEYLNISNSNSLICFHYKEIVCWVWIYERVCIHKINFLDAVRRSDQMVHSWSKISVN